MSYPTGEDVRQYLIASGVLTEEDDTVLLDLDLMIEATIEDFETRTGYIPFLAESGTSTRRIRSERPIRLWDLMGGIIPGTITEVLHTPLHASPTDSVNNSTFTVEEDYVTVPYDPSPRRRPVNLLKLVRRGHSGVLSVTGKWGYWTELPSDVRLALIQGAACMAYDPIRNKALQGEDSEDTEDGDDTGGLGNLPIEEVERGPLRVKLATSKEERRALFTSWETFYKSTRAKYRRDIIS